MGDKSKQTRFSGWELGTGTEEGVRVPQQHLALKSCQAMWIRDDDHNITKSTVLQRENDGLSNSEEKQKNGEDPTQWINIF